MTQLIPEGKTRLLLVEGNEDKAFFYALGQYLGYSNRAPLEVISCNGKDNLGNILRELRRLPRFEAISKIGIALDRDFGPDAFETVKNAIDIANQSASHQFTYSEMLLQPSDSKPSITLLIVPALNRKGTLEDLILDAISQDPIIDCVNKYFECVESTGIAIAEQRKSKGKLSTFISGKVLDPNNASNEDSRRKSLREAVGMKWWQEENMWERKAFADAKAFLSQLLNN